MIHHRDNSGSAVWGEWHAERAAARRFAFSLAEFGDIEIETYDLDTARVDGSDNPETYRPLGFHRDEELDYDVRDNPYF